MGARPAHSVSRRLGRAGFVRHAPGTPGYSVTGAGDGQVSVWHCNAAGQPLPAGPALQLYGRLLSEAGYRVMVVDGRFLRLEET